MRLDGGRWAYGVVETVLILLIIAILFFVAWFVHYSTTTATTTLDSTNKVAQSAIVPPGKTVITSYALCVKAPGSKLLETYPVQCITKDGKIFTNTAQ